MTDPVFLWACLLILLLMVGGLLAIAFKALTVAHDLAKIALTGGMVTPSTVPSILPKWVKPTPTPAPTTTPAPTPDVLKPANPPAKTPNEYDRMWAAMQISPQHQTAIDRAAKKILENKSRYEGVTSQTKVPWWVIGLIDQMEAGGGCDAHLHNGDPLKGRTIHVPAGRPPAPAEPPFTWEQSALDALAYEDFDKIPWGRGSNSLLSTAAAALEHYNGMGYHSKGVPSPYLWSFSNQYTSGKFVQDHVYDPNAISEQAGAMPILKALIALDPSIQL